MVAKVYKLLSEDEENRFDDEPKIIKVELYSSIRSQNSQVIEGLSGKTTSISLVTKQSRINDLMENVEIGDALEFQDKRYIIKNIEKSYMNFQQKGKRKYIITL